ncbi:hypothetical protein EMIHUDRAFT_207496 [Emiliania huxleyi CCMP1516]|uniref:NADH-ubiquinone oxidoreductase 21kDa subunit N-terminal domain-containing protein n=2 Tax=Emiliania huxleyi TaxID=2903 RepID=A0A0D3JA17_EMIH1|nr:hypothetical protein EMIHUDRAFT_242078 [Emiliania huxleyi CCMP1516]XP_005774738.1 hypothetical protein EMIHUDRAFT_207496 [Emiliania huxleyi CCMP1516]EOD20352.1 hypothetical protein EMIHUDRAFT_242078 [Emiliania huxleyi CCMP1516]EOD22309.1 hypothetical protein EMIHUDRAFT_207496 [Emiliania huxleyi CCMP1516]|mmetsp:Transcript_18016/g.53395  ORF Transcript_18016/g.53395 Transcript_18016/m.53395 type:complete len:108 (+) Transcript_18016:75-398(+)|eukprot:XP_005772781.1 hypothetical protein EMIHUDRAFT_242078 [Emiliania huxleyi CCMP1516]
MPIMVPPRFPTINASPTVGAVTRNFGIGDWLWVTSFTAFSAGVGFAIGKPIRRPTFFYAGALGFLMSYLGRYRINEYKLLGYYPNPSECRWAGIEFKELRPPIGIEP